VSERNRKVADTGWRPPLTLEIIVRMKVSFLVPNRQRRVAVSQILIHREGDPAGVVAAVPAQGTVVVGEGCTIYSAEAIVNPLVTVTVVVAGLEDKLCVDQLVVTIVAEHDIVPEEVQQTHISQVDDVVGIAVYLIAIVVQIVERSVKERSEGQTQNPVDIGSIVVVVPAYRDYRAIPYDRSRAIVTDGRRQRTTPVVM